MLKNGGKKVQSRKDMYYTKILLIFLTSEIFYNQCRFTNHAQQYQTQSKVIGSLLSSSEEAHFLGIDDVDETNGDLVLAMMMNQLLESHSPDIQHILLDCHALGDCSTALKYPV